MSLEEKEASLKLEVLKEQIDKLVEEYNEISNKMYFGKSLVISSNDWYASEEEFIGDEPWRSSTWCSE